MAIDPSIAPQFVEKRVFQQTARATAWLGQVLGYGAFAALLGYLSTAPAYTHLEPGLAEIKVSFSHAGQLAGECRELTAQEIAGYAPNMRRPRICPRARLPVRVELDLDDKALLHEDLQPAGLWHDGAATIYQTFRVPAGRHRLAARLRDSRRTEGFDYQAQRDVELAPRQSLVVEFSPERGGFVFE